MIYDHITRGAVVHGRVFAANTYTELDIIRSKAEAMGAALFVSGLTKRNGDDAELVDSTAIVGVLVAKATAGELGEVSPQAVIKAASQFAQLEWSSLEGHKRGSVSAGEAPREEGTFLLCWGPLPQVVLSVGQMKLTDEDDDDYDEELDGGEPLYDLLYTQDMAQMPGLEAVDGKKLCWTEFSGCKSVDLSEEAFARYRALVPLHREPKLFLTVRYD